jgi:hypothetical protein
MSGGNGSLKRAIIEKTFALRDLYWGANFPPRMSSGGCWPSLGLRDRMNKEQPKRIELTVQEVDALIERTQQERRPDNAADGLFSAAC